MTLSRIGSPVSKRSDRVSSAIVVSIHRAIFQDDLHLISVPSPSHPYVRAIRKPVVNTAHLDATTIDLEMSSHFAGVAGFVPYSEFPKGASHGRCLRCNERASGSGKESASRVGCHSRRMRISQVNEI